MNKFEYKKIRGDELIGIEMKNYNYGDKEEWEKLVKLDIEKETGIATRTFTKYENRDDIDESVKRSVIKATEFALNELGMRIIPLVSNATAGSLHLKPPSFRSHLLMRILPECFMRESSLPFLGSRVSLKGTHTWKPPPLNHM